MATLRDKRNKNKQTPQTIAKHTLSSQRARVGVSRYYLSRPQGLKQLRTRTFQARAPVGRIHRKCLGLQAQNQTQLIASLKAGLPVGSFHRLQNALEIRAHELAGIVQIPVRTLARRQREKHLDIDESERVLRIGSLFDRAVEVLGGEDHARHWLKSPQKALGGRTPLEYADTEPGAREVEDLLGRLEHGVFI